MLSTCISVSWALMLLSAMVPKQIRYENSTNQQIINEKEYQVLKKDKSYRFNRISNNYTIIAWLILSGSIPLSVMACLIVSNRLPEIELEAEQYNKEKELRKIRKNVELETEKELCNANKTVTVTAHEKDLEKAFVELADASNWVSTDEEGLVETVNTEVIDKTPLLPDSKKDIADIETNTETVKKKI